MLRSISRYILLCGRWWRAVSTIKQVELGGEEAPPRSQQENVSQLTLNINSNETLADHNTRKARASNKNNNYPTNPKPEPTKSPVTDESTYEGSALESSPALRPPLPCGP